jgi:hypothetical protein
MFFGRLLMDVADLSNQVALLDYPKRVGPRDGPVGAQMQVGKD